MKGQRKGGNKVLGDTVFVERERYGDLTGKRQYFVEGERQTSNKETQ